MTTYPTGSSPTSLPRLEHHDFQVGLPLLQKVGGKGPRDAAPHYDDVGGAGHLLGRPVAQQLLRRLLVPVRLGRVVYRQAGLAWK